MTVRKRCRTRGCKTSPRCAHPWWLDVMYKGARYRMTVDEFAFARGATIAVASKQEAEKTWEPKFIAEIASGKDPRVTPHREASPEQPATRSPISSGCIGVGTLKWSHSRAARES